MNKANFRLAVLLSDKYKNLMLIGDDSQSIYAFRGSDLQLFLDFTNSYKAKIYKLEQNYRSTQNIVNASNIIISRNKAKLEKTAWTDNNTGDKIIYYRADNEYEEAGFVANIIDNYVHKMGSYAYKDFMILYRSHHQARLIEESLMRNYIPYNLGSGIGFYERKEIKDALAYIRIIVNPNDFISFQRIANEPKRGAGDTSVKKIIEFGLENNLNIFETLERLKEIPKMQKKAIAALEELNTILKGYRLKILDKTPGRFIADVLYDIGYLQYLIDNDDGERINNIDELIRLADEWKEANNVELSDIRDFIREVNLFTNSDEEASDNAVKLLTAHSSKGLEEKIVFIIGAEDGIFPHRSVDAGTGDIEEERRLFYVAMTRAKEKLFLVSAQERRFFGQKPMSTKTSRFIRDIPKDMIKIV